MYRNRTTTLNTITTKFIYTMIYKVMICTKKDNEYNWKTKYFKFPESAYKEICKAVKLDNFEEASIEPFEIKTED